MMAQWDDGRRGGWEDGKNGNEPKALWRDGMMGDDGASIRTDGQWWYWALGQRNCWAMGGEECLERSRDPFHPASSVLPSSALRWEDILRTAITCSADFYIHLRRDRGSASAQAYLMGLGGVQMGRWRIALA